MSFKISVYAYTYMVLLANLHNCELIMAGAPAIIHLQLRSFIHQFNFCGPQH